MATVIVAGCAQGYVLQTPFDAEAMAWSLSPGSRTVAGQAFLRTAAGEIRTCAGGRIVLVPDTAYTEEIRSAFLSGQAVANRDGRLLSYRRESPCDAEGRFGFGGLPDGRWLVVADILAPEAAGGDAARRHVILYGAADTTRQDVAGLMVTQ